MSPGVLIIGGAGEMGRWYARFLKRAGWEVSINDTDPEAEKIACHIGCGVEPDLSCIGEFDVVLISIPIDKVADVVKTVAPGMRDGSLLCDLTSVKVEPVKVMTDYAPNGVEVIGMHPLFGPTLPDAAGQTVILTPVRGRSEKWLPEIKSIHTDAGARIEVISPAEHDHMTSVVQGLTHFVYIAMGGTLRALDFDVSGSRRFTSPIYDIFLDIIGRILAQDPRLYALIQTNLDLKEVHSTFADECRRLTDMVSSKDMEGVQDYICAAREHFGDVQGALERSDHLVARRIEELSSEKSGKPPGNNSTDC